MPEITTADQLTAWMLAHRVILAYVVKAVQTALPEEGTLATRDATVTMLNNSIPQFMADIAKVDKTLADRLTALAQAEVDSIFLAPILPTQPSSRV
jgi:hypothetical protein